MNAANVARGLRPSQLQSHSQTGVVSIAFAHLLRWFVFLSPAAEIHIALGTVGEITKKDLINAEAEGCWIYAFRSASRPARLRSHRSASLDDADAVFSLVCVLQHLSPCQAADPSCQGSRLASAGLPPSPAPARPFAAPHRAIANADAYGRGAAGRCRCALCSRSRAQIALHRAIDHDTHHTALAFDLETRALNLETPSHPAQAAIELNVPPQHRLIHLVCIYLDLVSN